MAIKLEDLFFELGVVVNRADVTAAEGVLQRLSAPVNKVINVSVSQPRVPINIAASAHIDLAKIAASLQGHSIAANVVADKAALVQSIRNALQGETFLINVTAQAPQQQPVINMTASTSALKDQQDALTRLRDLAVQYVGAFSVGAFVKQLATVRGEFQKQLVTLEAITQSALYSREIFSQIQELAVKSPFQFKDLTDYAKQLSAYQLPTDEIFETTRRLSDLSAGLGVDMRRIILAYGQVRSASVLKGTELRQFTEAGIPMVQALADKFSELEGRVVSTADVFERISAKSVPFEMVKEIIEDLTDDTGKFFNMQEKQADTLAGKLSNLRDAYDVFLNRLGTQNQGILDTGLSGLYWLMNNASDIIRIIMSIATTYGIYRLATYSATAANRQIISSWEQQTIAAKRQQAELALLSAGGYRHLSDDMKTFVMNSARLTAQDIVGAATAGNLNQALVNRYFLLGRINAAQLQLIYSTNGWSAATAASLTALNARGRMLTLLGNSLVQLGATLKNLGKSMLSVLASPQTWILAAVGALVELFSYYRQANTEINRFAENVQERFASLSTAVDDFLKTHAKLLDALAEDSISEDNAFKLLNRLTEEITNQIPGANSIIVEAKLQGGDDIIAQARYMEQAFRNVSEAAKIAAESAVTTDAGRHIGNWFDDDAQKDIDQLGRWIAKVVELRQTLNPNQYFFTARNEARKEAEAIAEEIRQGIDAAAITDANAQKAYVKVVLQSILESWRQNGAVITKEASDYFRTIVEANILGIEQSDTAWNVLLSNIRAAVKKSNLDIYDLSEANLRKISEQAMIHVRETNPAIYNEVKALVSDINRLEAFIRIGFRTETDESSLRKVIGASVERQLGLTGATSVENRKAILGKKSRAIAAINNEMNTSDIISTYQRLIATEKREVKNLQNALAEQGKTDAEKRTLQDKIDKSQESISLWRMVLTALNASEESDKDIAKNQREADRAQRERERAQSDEIKRIRSEYEFYRKAIAEYEKLRQYMSDAAAMAQLVEMEGFSALDTARLRRYLGDESQLPRDILSLLEGKDYEQAINLRTTMQANLGRAQADALIDSEESRLHIMEEQIDSLREQYDLFTRVRDITGDIAAASAVALGVGGGNAVLSDLMIREFDRLSSANFGKSFAELAAMGDEERNRLLGNEAKIASRYESIVAQLAKERENLLVTGAEVMTRLGGHSVELAKLQLELTEQLRSVDALRSAGLIGDAEHTFASDMLRAGNALSVLKLTSDYEKLMEAALSLTQEQATTTAQSIESTLNDALIKGAISAQDYAKQMQQVRAQVDAVAQRHGVLRTLWSGGIEGLIERNSDIATSRQLAAAIELTAAGEAYRKACAEGDEEAKEAAQKRVQAAKEELSTAERAVDSAARMARAFADVKGVVGELADFAKGINDMVGSVATTAKAFGTDVESGSFLGILQDSTAALMGAMDGINKSMQAASEGDWAGAMAGAAAALASVAQVADSSAEERRAKRRKAYEIELKEMENLYASLQRSREHALGSTSEYTLAQLDALREQQKRLEKLRDNELDAKSSDKQVVQDFENQIAEISDAIRMFSEDILEEELGVSLHDWASKIGDALVTAFREGTNAVEAFDKSVDELFANLLQNMFVMSVIEPMMERWRTALFGEDGAGGWYGADHELDMTELEAWRAMIEADKAETLQAAEMWRQMMADTLGYDAFTGGTTGAGLSAGIKSITEDQANLLASYLNAIRMDVSIDRSIIESTLPQITIITQAQLAQLETIAAATKSTATTTERIEATLNSVITTSPNGKRVRV